VKRFDVATIAGLLAAFGFILLGNHIEGGHVAAIVQPTAALIVFGGTLGSVLISFPIRSVLTALKASRELFQDSADEPAKRIEEILRYAQLARKDGILALEQEIEKVSDSYMKAALMMVVDGFDSATIREALENEIAEREEQGEIPAKVFECAGGYSPTIGIIGAVLGLIHVMANLADISKVGAGIAVAFVATIYGVGAANIVFLPAANKLKIKHRQRMILHEMTLFGTLGLQQGQNPRAIAARLTPFTHGHGDVHPPGKDAGTKKAAA
jgi:chemotaxis protein MotA